MENKTLNFSLNSFLFLICIVVSLFQNYELTFLVWSLTFLLTVKQKYSISIIKYTSIFGAILLIAFIPNLFIYYYFKSSQELRYFKSVLYLIIFKKK